jgi:hypothetical protein
MPNVESGTQRRYRGGQKHRIGMNWIILGISAVLTFLTALPIDRWMHSSHTPLGLITLADLGLLAAWLFVLSMIGSGTRR